jgi:hypothetical protein
MSKKHEWKRNLEEVNDAEIYDAIRYLESDPTTSAKHSRGHSEDTAFAIGVTVVILLLGCLGFVWLYWR